MITIWFNCLVILLLFCITRGIYHKNCFMIDFTFIIEHSILMISCAISLNLLYYFRYLINCICLKTFSVITNFLKRRCLFHIESRSSKAILISLNKLKSIKYCKYIFTSTNNILTYAKLFIFNATIALWSIFIKWSLYKIIFIVSMLCHFLASFCIIILNLFIRYSLLAWLVTEIVFHLKALWFRKSLKFDYCIMFLFDLWRLMFGCKY